METKKDRVYTVKIKFKDSFCKEATWFTVKVLGYDYGTDVVDTVNKNFGNKVEFNSYNPIAFVTIEEFLKEEANVLC